MAKNDAMRDLLCGILALKNGLVDRGALADALHARDDGEATPLARVLRDRGSLTPEDESLLDGLVRRHLGRHGDDPERSLAELDPAGSVRRMLSLLADTRPSDGVHSAGTTFDAEEAGSPRDAGGRAVGGAGAAGPRFRIVRPHARGGLGEVFLAVDDELNRIVALKRIQARFADDPRSQMRFLVEGEITGGLEHPGIVPVYGLGLDDRDGRPYYAMRFIGGESLREAILRFHGGDGHPDGDPARRSLALRQLLGRFVDVCDAMEYAHSRGVLHRDLKPSNIMLGRYGETIVVDWGLAKATGSAGPPAASEAEGADAVAETILRPRSGSEPVETAAGSALGTPAYMSPEQAAGEPGRLGPASDIYSLGATLYCLLTGRPPFQEEDVSALMAKVVRGEFPPPRAVRPDVPAPLEAVCLKAMARAPEARYASPRLLAEDIERWLADEPVSALREPWTERARRWSRRHRSLVTGAAAALIVALVALGGILALEADSNRRLRLANDREKRAREQAQARFQLARDAVAGYYRGVSEDVLLKRTEFRDLRRSLLKSAMDYYQKLAAILAVDQEIEPGARLDLARADLALARIIGEIASSADAMKSAEQARDLFARLAAERPDDPDIRRELATTLYAISLLHDGTGHPDASLASLREALAIRQALARTRDATPDDRRALARTHGNIGNRLDDLGREPEALASYEECRRILESLVAEQPNDARHASELARVLGNIGGALARIGRLDEALRSVEESHATRKRLADAHPGDVDLQGDLAGSFTYLGRLRARTGRPAEAMEALQQSAAINRALVAANPNSTALRRHLANNYNDIGFYHADANRLDEALRAIQQAREIQEAIVAANPEDLSYANDLATSLTNIGLLNTMTGRADRALPLYEQSLALRSKLADANPDDINARSKLAWTHHSIGTLHAETGRPADALGPMEQARAIRQSLVDAHPDLLQLRAALAESLQSLGLLHDDLSHPAEALRWLEQARAAHEALHHAEPRVTRHRRELARTLSDISRVHRHAGRAADALKPAEESRTLVEILLRDDPEDFESRGLLGQSWIDSGSALAQLQRYDEAVAADREALAHYRAVFERDPQAVRFRKGLSDAYGNLSEALLARRHPAEAAAAAREIRALWPRDADELYGVARLLTACAKPSRPGEPPGGRTDPVLDEAMEALRRAVDAGFRDAHRLREDTTLDPLRPRADFRALVTDLGFPADPFR